MSCLVWISVEQAVFCPELVLRVEERTIDTNVEHRLGEMLMAVEFVEATKFC